MQEQVKKIVYEFKEAGWSVQKLEQQLKFSNGTLGKVISGKAGISDFRLNQLLKFYEATFSPKVVVQNLNQTEDLKFAKPVKKEAAQNESINTKVEYTKPDENAFDGKKVDRYLLDEVGVWEKPITDKELEELSLKAKKDAIQRIKDLEEEIKHPPKNPIIGLSKWYAVRYNEIKTLKLKYNL